MTLRVLIADDEDLARERLRRLLQTEPDVTIVNESATGPETLAAIERDSPHVVFLDVGMPDLDGFGVVQSLKPDQRPVVVFVTAHGQFALRAFDAHAADYLLKPFHRDRFKQAIQRARELVQRRESHPHLPAPEPQPHTAATAKSPDRIAVRSDGRILFVRVEDIRWIQSADNYSELHVRHGRSHLVRITLASLERRLPRPRFVRINRSLIVNVDSIREIRPKSHGDSTVILHDDTALPASRKYRASLLRVLGRA